ncbi:hypothetical protein HPB49_016639 [Dermacentor silvarum]|uniref:Uncharacterized protein n=1 Tax=Dermacentor silvarum TaxID=543639 RepID=A0ACB8CG71_DERSI|nr:uncharacterized protein LOC125947249 [Dermacentor silvarum]KAH7941734.1 hypothetical protein HPB49_016639 [Dermacentor silvarum]
MAALMRMDEGGAAPAKVTAEKSSQRRVNWSVSTTESLIRLWEDTLAALRSNTRNARIYDEMTRSLNARLPAGEVPFTAKQLRQKLENLNKQYRKLRRCGTSTGSKGVEWPFYWQLHAFLGTLPVNDSDLVEESVEVPEVYEAPDDAEVVASWDATTTDQEDSFSTGCLEESPAPTNENCGAAQNAASPAASCPPSSRKRKRPSFVLQDLMTMFSRAEDRAAENAKESLQLRKELVELQKEANEINKNMAEMVNSYFASRQNKG